jgi:hypothetical protein
VLDPKPEARGLGPACTHWWTLLEQLHEGQNTQISLPTTEKSIVQMAFRSMLIKEKKH